jgi:hypothetical protein
VPSIKLSITHAFDLFKAFLQKLKALFLIHIHAVLSITFGSNIIFLVLAQYSKGRRCNLTHNRKKLIEVALPLDAINSEAAKEKSIRHGHPSTLHLWWARRPLAAARA